MSRLEAWLQRSKEEMKQGEEQGFPDDVDAEIKWTKVRPSYLAEKCRDNRDCKDE